MLLPHQCELRLTRLCALISIKLHHLCSQYSCYSICAHCEPVDRTICLTIGLVVMMFLDMAFASF